MGFVVRWIFAFLLVTATFNPTQYNYLRWGRTEYATQTSVVVLLGLLLVIGYIIFMRATLRSIGAFGMFLVGAVFAAMIWVLYDWGILTLENTQLNTWLGLLALSLIMAVGISWSFIRRSLTGQYDVDDADE